MNPPVDVLIIGAGASGAAVAWSLADTRMRILCLEQGDWVKYTDYPSNHRDYEARQLDAFNFSPNRRQSPVDYPVNEKDSPIKIANFNGVGGGTILYAGHFPRFHPGDFKVRTLDGVADDWPIDYWTLEPYYAENDRMMGVSGLAGDPAYPPKQPQMKPVAMVNATVQCYYRDDRVMRSLDMEARPPFPKGFDVEQGDWTLLDPVRSRPKLYRDAP